MLKLPIGVQSFSKVRERGYYYVDKTRFIDDILREGSEVYLYTRPRRFGKSLNLSMLECYLNMDHKGNTWFDGLDVSALRPDDPWKNSHPVIPMDMKGMPTVDFENRFLPSFARRISDLYRRFPELMESPRLDEFQKQDYIDVLARNADESTLSESLRILSDMLYAHHGIRTVILLDEYDDPVNNASDACTRRKILAFMESLMSSAFKGNDSMEFGVVTGIMQIAKGSIFSGFNNPTLNNVLSKGYDKMLGFTGKEIVKMCSDAGHPEKLPEIEEWYDGYRFGDSAVYNPWSVLNYFNNGMVPGTYWGGTSGNEILDTLLESRGSDEDLKILAEGGSLRRSIDTTVTFEDLSMRAGSIYAVMVMSGYLTAVPAADELYDVSLPNIEMFDIFPKKITYRVSDDANSDLTNLRQALEEDDPARVGKYLSDLFMEFESVRILSKESDHRDFILGLMVGFRNKYKVSAEAGEGYCDIRLESRDGSRSNVVMEIKRCTDDDATDAALEKLARRGLRRIEEKHYAEGLKGKTAVYGVAFKSKTPKIAMEILEH